MTVLDVRLAEDFEYRQTTDERNRNTYAMRWIVTTNDREQPNGSVAIESQLTGQGYKDPIPPLWSIYSHNGYVDQNSYLKSGLTLYKPQPHQKPTMWHIDGTYSPLDPGQTPDTGSTNPLLRPIIYSTEGQAYNRLISEDKDGKPILNTAGMEFNPPIEEQGEYDVLNAIKNVSDLNEVIQMNNTYRYSVNSDVFYGAQPRHAKIDSIKSGALVTEGEQSYYAVSIRIVFNYEPWDVKVLNQGLHARRAPEVYPERVFRNGVPVAEPVLLDADGRELEQGIEGNYVTARVRREVPYAGLGI